MRIGLILAFCLVLLPVAALCEPQTMGTLWQRDGTLLVRTKCKSGDFDDQYCRAIVLRDGRGTRTLGNGYMDARLVWSRHGGHGGPDALVIGESGGSGGYAELFAVTIKQKTRIKKLVGERLEGLRAKPGAGGLRLDLPFDVEFFNGAPHAGAVIVPIPTIWINGDFSADISALVQPRMSQREFAFRKLAVEQELRGWANAKYPSPRLYPPMSDEGTAVTVQALLDLMLTGHADQARELLDDAWPASYKRSDFKLGGEADFWKSVCRTILRNPLWTRLHLGRIPNAIVIRRGAAIIDRH